MKNNIKIVAISLFLMILSINAQTFSTDSNDGRNQAQFISDAPFEKIVGLANGLDATVMLNLNDITRKPMGKVKVAIAKINSGIELRDEHLRSEMWLNANKFPNAEFQLLAIKNPTSKTLVDGQKVKAKILGKFSVHGVTKDVEVATTLTYFKESAKTIGRTKGNLLIINATFSIKLSDFGIKIPDMVVSKLNDTVEITTNFVASDANSSANPCGTTVESKSDNKCNPCATKSVDKKESPCNPCSPKK
jgi:polyisoprenoid-binding protein YceI